MYIKYDNGTECILASVTQATDFVFLEFIISLLFGCYWWQFNCFNQSAMLFCPFLYVSKDHLSSSNAVWKFLCHTWTSPWVACQRSGVYTSGTRVFSRHPQAYKLTAVQQVEKHTFGVDQQKLKSVYQSGVSILFMFMAASADKLSRSQHGLLHHNAGRRRIQRI